MSTRRPSSRTVRPASESRPAWPLAPLQARVRAWIDRREQTPPAPALQMESLEPRLLLSADLTASAATLDPATLAAGQAAAVTVQLLNAGSEAPATPVRVELYASTDATLDASDVRVASTTVEAEAFVPGTAVDRTLSADTGALAAAGSYTLLGRIDPQNAIAESDEGNNDFALSTALTVQARLGAQPNGSQVPALTLTDADGTRFTLAISGSGTVEVSRETDGYRLAIRGSDASTTLTLAASGGDGRVRLSGLTADAALGSLALGTASLAGEAQFAGSVKAITLASVLPGARLAATSLGSLNVSGDFLGDLTLAGAGPSAYTLGPAQVGGLLGGHWQVGGRAYSLTAAGSTAGWIANLQGPLVQFVTTGNVSGLMAVPALQLLQVGGSLEGFRLLVGTDLGSDGLPGGSGAAADRYGAGTLGRVRVGGDVHDSLIAVGLDPVDGQYSNGDDTVLGGSANRLQELIIGGRLTGSSAIVAPALPASVRVDGQTLAPASLPQLGTSALDTVAPTLTAALASDTGTAPDDGLTQDPTIAGTASDTSGTVTLTGRLDGNGGFSALPGVIGAGGAFTLDAARLATLAGGALADGAHTLELLARDGAGNATAVVSVGFVLDTAAPTLGELDLDPISDTGTPGDHSTTAATVTLIGQSEAGARVELPDLGLSTLADALGRFTFAGLALAPGANPFTLAATDRAGNRRMASVTLTRTLPDTTVPTLAAALTHDTGVSATDSLTRDATIGGTASDDTALTQLLGALDPAAADAPLTDFSSLLQADGRFTLDAAVLAGLAGGTLTDGAHVLRLVALDAAGNRTQTEVAFTLDTQAPAAPALALDPASDSGASEIDAITRDATPTLQLSTAAGTVLRLLRDGTDLGPVEAGALTLAALADGSYAFTATATDAAGNVSVASSTLQIVIDTSAPGAPVFDLAADSDSDPLGDHTTTADTVTLQGSTTPGSRVSLDGSLLSTTADAGGAFTLAGVALVLGDNLLALTATDVAGNQSSASRTITRTAPGSIDSTAPTLTAALSNDTGVSASDGLTRDAGIRGSATDDTAVTQLLGALDPAGDSAPLTDLSALLQTDGSFTLDAAALATLAGSPLVDGAHLLRLVALDAAGNRTQTEVAFTLDTAAPGLSSIALAASADTGTAGDNITSAARVLLTGVAQAGDRIEVLGQAITALAGAGGAFQLADVALSEGENSLSLQLSDRAGNTATTAFTLTRSGEAGQDVVLDWISQALEAVRRDATDPPIATRWLAMESLAVYDTLAAIDGTPAYLTRHTVTGPVSTEAAIATAAHRVLVRAYPAQQAAFDAALAASLAAVPDGTAKSAGIALGLAVAEDVLALRAGDGSDAFVTYPGSTAMGAWRPTGPMYEVADEPQWGELTPFALASADEFRPAAPPALDSAEYAASVEEIRALGSATSTVRTAEQTRQAQFWADGAGTYTPPGHWLQIAAQLAGAQGNSLAANARLFAQLNVALADAAIAAWDAKYTYGLWRPETAIANADLDGNPATTQEDGWTSLLITPSHPEYVSGHSTFSAAAAGILSATFGADTAFTTTSYALPGITRSYTSFDEAAAEAGRSRVYGGIHYEFTNQAGQQLGHAVADAVLARFALAEDSQAPGISTDALAPVVAGNPTLSGRVLDNLSGIAESRYSLDGASAQALVLDAEGRFVITTAFALDGSADGVHTLSLTAVDAAGNATATVTRSFTLDTRAPALTLTSLDDGDLLDVASRLSGSADPTGSPLTELSYTLDGQARRNLVFDATTGAFDQVLAIGELGIGNHTLVLTARDAAGNVTTLSRTLTLDQLAPFTVTSVTPTDGASDVGVTFRPQVYFSRAVNTATLTANSLYATGPDGTKLSTTIVPSLDGSFAWLFFNNPMPGGSTITLHVNGALIRAASDGAFLDADGDGTAKDELTTTFTTVSTTPVLGTKLVGRVVDPGPDLLPMTFDDIRRGPDGVIHTADDVFLNPIAHAKVWILGRESEVIYTDANGYFELNNVPVGDVKLAVDGRTATNAPSGVFFPEMVMDLTLRPGITNTAMGSMGSLAEQQDNADRQELYLPRIATAVLQDVSDTGTTVITLEQEAAPDLTEQQRAALTLTVPAGSAIGENGEVLNSVQIGIATVPPELVRDMLPPGVLEHTFDITIQAPGVATFAEPVQITFPNVFNAAPGTKLNILSFDHTTGRLVINGTGTVSTDGLKVVSDPDSGIRAPGWHGLTPPSSQVKINSYLEATLDNESWIPSLLPPIGSGVFKFDTNTKTYYTKGDGKGGTTPNEAANNRDAIINAVLASDQKIAVVATDAPRTGTSPVSMGSDNLLLYRWGLGDVPNGFDHVALAYQKRGTDGSLLFHEDGSPVIIIAELNPDHTQGGVFNSPSPEPRGLSEFSQWYDEVSAVSLNGFDDHQRTKALQMANEFSGSTYSIYADTGNTCSTAVLKTLLNSAGVPDENVPYSRLGLNTITPGDVVHFVQKINQELYKTPLQDVPDQFLGGSVIRAVITTEIVSSGTFSDIIRSSLKEIIDNPEIISFGDAAPLLTSTSTGKTFYRIDSVAGTAVPFTLFGQSDNNGQINFSLAPNSSAYISLLHADSQGITSFPIVTGASGVLVNSNFIINSSRVLNGGDADKDGLFDYSEYILGTNPKKNDTDNDGLKDFIEIQQNTNPLGSNQLSTGVIASSNLIGDAKAIAVVAANTDANQLFAYVSTDRGLAIIDVSVFTNPVTLAQLDFVGTNQDLAVDTVRNIAAVASGNAGLHLIDVSNRNAPKLLQTLSFIDAVTAVVIRDGLAYAASGSSLAVIDLNTGELRQTLAGGIGPISDLALDGDTLYAVSTNGRLGSYTLSGLSLSALDTLSLPASGGRLFVGGGVAYIGAGNGGTGGYVTADVSDPTNLRLLSGVDANGVAGTAIVANGSGLAVGVGSSNFVFGGFKALDVFSSADPTNTGNFITRINLPEIPRNVVLANGLAFVADGSGGLQIVNYAAFDTKGIPPQVSLTIEGVDVDPTTPGLQMLEGQTIHIMPTVSDDVQVRSVDLLVNGQTISRDIDFPFELFTLATPLAAGNNQMTLQIRAVDTGGNSTLSDSIVIDVVPDKTPPKLLNSTIASGDIFAQGDEIIIQFEFDESIDMAKFDDAFALIDSSGLLINPNKLSYSTKNSLITINYGTVKNGDYRFFLNENNVVDLSGNALNPLPDNYINFSVQEFTNVWTGSSNNGLWSDARNWKNLKIPTTNATVFIKSDSDTIEYNSGKLSIKSVITNADLSITGGELTIEESAVFNKQLIMEGGIINGDADMLIKGGLVWKGGNMGGNGKTVVFGNSKLGVPATENVNELYMYGGRTITNKGFASIIGASSITFGASGHQKFINDVDATFSVDLTTDNSFFEDENFFASNIGSTFENKGLLIKNNDTYLYEQASFINSGVIHINSGSLSLSGKTTFDGGVINIDDGAYFDMSRGNLNIINDAYINGDFYMSGGTIDGDADLTIAGDMYWYGGTMSGNGRTILKGDTIIRKYFTYIDHVYLDGNRTLENQGKIEQWGLVTVGFNAGNSLGSGKIVNSSGAEYHLYGTDQKTVWVSQNMSDSDDGNDAAFDNFGKFIFSSYSGITTNLDVRINNHGLMEVKSGTLKLNKNSSLNGSVIINDEASIVLTEP